MTDGPKLNPNAVQAKGIRKAAKARAMAELWRRCAHLDQVLDPVQMEMVDGFDNFDREVNPLYVWLCSRRIGKSVGLSAYADMYCRRNPGARILYLSKTTDNVKEIIDQSFGHVLATCPTEMRPELRVKDNKYLYKNGSEIRFKGMDKVGGDSIRGIKADLTIFDEFCFMDKIKYLLDSVIMPMIIATGGRCLLASTPPETPGHESISIIQRCEFDGAIIKKNIYDCPRWSRKQIAQFEKEAGGVDSDLFQREYMCKIVVERERAILPACTEAKMNEIVREMPRPEDYQPDFYVSLDIGFRDMLVALFGYWDYPNARLIIEREWVIKQADTKMVADNIKRIEKELFRGIKPYKRISDTDPRLIADLRRLHNLQFSATKKDNKEAQVNQTNIMMSDNQIIIDPSCVHLIRQCKYGIWNKMRTQFDRTEALGHSDAIDALLYMVRNVVRSRDPYVKSPLNTGYYVDHGSYGDSGKNDELSKMFKRGR